ncbi:AMP-binding protein [Cellulosimicrobium funkei]|uniref:AMP-binding protein n=1 Tax=Cellulosimicrobium funkei TaxID=264251 RepID=UPI00341E3FAA
MNRAVVPADLDALVAAVGAALDGDGPPVAPVPLLPRPPGSGPAPTGVPAGTALVLRTSGSTGTPREVLLGADALRASGAATHERLGGPGHWLLTLPPTHVAGVQVVARAHAAGRGLTVAPAGEPFTPGGFAALVARAPRGERRYVSLVPTQLHRLVEAADAGSADGAAGLDALRSLDAVLLGGAATPPALLRRARSAGARVVTTYGMTETCGGCVYDGVPLPGARVRLVPAGDTQGEEAGEGAGVVELSGPFLADGYLDEPAATAAAFRTDDDGTRWFRTSDLGRLDGPVDSPVLVVLGRADDVIVTGGVNVAPAAVEAVVGEVAGVGEACVVGVPHPEWGQEVVAVVTLAGAQGDDGAAAGTAGAVSTAGAAGTAGAGGVTSAPPELVAAVRGRVADRLERAAAPRRVLVVPDLPRRGPGKVDRAAVARIAVGHGRTPPG